MGRQGGQRGAHFPLLDGVCGTLLLNIRNLPAETGARLAHRQRAQVCEHWDRDTEMPARRARRQREREGGRERGEREERREKRGERREERGEREREKYKQKYVST